MSAQHTPGLHAAAHMAECRHQKHDSAVHWRMVWHALTNTGFGWHPEATGARQQMRLCIAAARSYRAGQKRFAAIAKATGSAS